MEEGHERGSRKGTRKEGSSVGEGRKGLVC